MSNMLDLIKQSNQLALAEARNEIRVCNQYTEKFGLTLSEEEITELVECRKNSLKASGRVEFGGGILPKLIFAFCDSPYIEQSEYMTTMAELQDSFYYYKTAAEDAYTDDELIEFMVNVFNGRAQGSLEYLISTSLDSLCRYGKDADYDEHDADEVGDLF